MKKLGTDTAADKTANTAANTAANKKKTAKNPTKKSVARLTTKKSVENEPTPLVPLAEAPRPLSMKEKTVLEFLEFYIRANGVSPTYQEICNHFGFASFNSVQRYLKQLEVKGYIQLPWSNQKRAINLLKPSSALQSSIEGIYRDHSRETDSRLEEMPSVMSINQVGKSVALLGMPTENFSLPLLGRVAAGAPIEAYEHDEFIDVPASLVRHADRTYALRVQGQSMIEDGILDGDVILVQRQSTATNGEIVVAMIGEEATVKRFYRKTQEKMIELRPANSTMQSMWFDPKEIQIRGVVVGLIRKFM